MNRIEPVQAAGGRVAVHPGAAGVSRIGPWTRDSAFVAQQYSTDPSASSPRPGIINLVADSQEREPLDLPYMHSWTVTHFNRLLGEFQASIEREPPVPQNAPLDFVPSEAQQRTQQPGPR